MVRRMFSQLLLLWSLIGDLYAGVAHYEPKEPSWKNQNLSFVPLALDARLRRLDLSNNFITQLHTLALPFLEQLDLSFNRLDFISEDAFQNLARLEHLNLSRNALNNNIGRNSKALRSMSMLKTLDMSMNGLSDDAAQQYLRDKPSLSQLKMTGNALRRLSHNMFKESKHLQSIVIDNNLISVIEQGTFEPLRQLEMLNLAKNNLANICDFKLDQVKYLDLSRNSVEFFVTHEDEQLYRLEILDLSHNKLLYFPVVPKINHLKYLHLQNNMVGALYSEPLMVSQANGLYSELMRERIVQKNNLHSNWRLMPVIYIDLSYNHFKSFPLETLSLLSSLETLNFSHNCLQNIMWNFRNDKETGHPRKLVFTSLKYLDMQSNGLVYISPLFFNALTQVETLNLQGNSLQPCDSQSAQRMHLKRPCVVFEWLKTLKHLNLKENNMQMLYPNTFLKTSLVSLNLAGNSHLVMKPGALEDVQNTLESLIISDTNMSSSDLSLPCMPKLTELNISNNHLDLLPSSLICSSLRELDIRNNHFVSLNHSLILALSVHLNVMYISGNLFNCCDSKWLTFLNASVLPNINETVCFTSDRNVLMTGGLNKTSADCLATPQEIHISQMIIIVLFICVISTVLITSTRKVCCKDTFYIE